MQYHAAISTLFTLVNPRRTHSFRPSLYEYKTRFNRSMSSSNEISNEWISLDPNSLPKSSVYKLGISSIVPRPVAVITSVSSAGILNCAPFSYSGLFSHDPPLVATGICMSSKGKKDTLVNIEETEEWVFNVLSDSWMTEANACSAEVDSSVNELEIAGLSSIPSQSIKAPRIKQAMVSMECKLFDKKEVYNDEGTHTTTIVMGRIVRYHVHQSVVARDEKGEQQEPVTVDLQKMRFVGRAGDITYWPAGDGSSVSMKRP